MNFNIFLISVTALSVTLFGACHNAHQHEAHEGEHTDADEHGHNHGADEITFTEAQAKAAELQITRVRDKDCVKNRVKRANIVRSTLC